ncbi:hypothetical protein GCK72_004807 [Caenorhabditis remanei]|uniref:Arrestin-like N-terminal domain-containing protein n=1 Tax=Caenorhabditis remanei TaxID=31234 RepID=A0A6A5HCF4_CAERE|nr:hypothetical protein GCK72_004807 [Caenorhabditis remanei]KAF1764857.1 hypothetical protein GCK72_004807 [Caenorhabditis remanei]
MFANISQSCIHYDCPHYFPGDIVTGTIVLHFEKDLRASRLKISWRGDVLATHIRGDNGEHHKSFSYFSDHTIAWRADNGLNKLPAGHHRFPFSFQLPEKLLPSYSPKPPATGYVRYFVSVKIVRPMRINYFVRKNFLVAKQSELPSYSSFDRMPPPNYEE